MKISENERKYRLAASMIVGLGPKRFLKALRHWGCIKTLWELSEKELKDVFGQKIGTKIYSQCYESDIEECSNDIDRIGIKYAVYGDGQYPKLLEQISDPPITIYYKGSIGLDILKSTLTIVGTRKSTSYGYNFLKKLIPELVEKGICTVSGMAFGIDKIVHELTLESEGYTAAVLASDVNKPTPRSNYEIYRKILKNGLVLSEYLPGKKIKAGNFAQRNRILAGLSPTILIIEAPERSGSLITGHLAFDYNRDVLALPGDITKGRSEGCNHMIKINRAQLIDSPEDVIKFLGFNLEKTGQISVKELPEEYKKIITTIRTNEYNTIDKIIVSSDMDRNQVLTTLTEMEIRGYLYKDEQEIYQLKI